MLVPGSASLKSMEDLKGRTLVTPDPDSITAVMVRAMFRGEKLHGDLEKEPSPTTVRVITTRYQDAGCGLHRERLRASRRDRRQRRRKGVDREGRQGAAAVAAGPDQADHRVDQVAGGRTAADPRRDADAAGLEARPRRARGRRPQGVRSPDANSRARRSRGWASSRPPRTGSTATVPVTGSAAPIRVRSKDAERHPRQSIVFGGSEQSLTRAVPPSTAAARVHVSAPPDATAPAFTCTGADGGFSLAVRYEAQAR